MPLVPWIMENLVRENRACVAPQNRVEIDVGIESFLNTAISSYVAVATDIEVESEPANDVLIFQELDTTIEVFIEECCSMNNIGDDMRVTGTWTDFVGARVDPTSVQAAVRAPSGIETIYTWPASITRTSAGVFYLTIDLTESGIWRGRFFSTGSGKAVEFFSFIVNANEF